jgi:hypothetical protein
LFIFKRLATLQESSERSVGLAGLCAILCLGKVQMSTTTAKKLRTQKEPGYRTATRKKPPVVVGSCAFLQDDKGVMRCIPFPQTGSDRMSTWRSNLHSYQQQSALLFSSEKNLDAFIDGLWADSSLRDMPRAHVGDNTVIVPTEAVELLRNLYGFEFVDSPVVPSAAAPQRK